MESRAFLDELREENLGRSLSRHDSDTISRLVLETLMHAHDGTKLDFPQARTALLSWKKQIFLTFSLIQGYSETRRRPIEKRKLVQENSREEAQGI